MNQMQEFGVELPQVRSTRTRAVGRSKRKTEAEIEGDEETAPPGRQDNERQAKLEQALMQQLEMQKKLHEQLEVALTNCLTLKLTIVWIDSWFKFRHKFPFFCKTTS